jgi:glycosyltransferase involved in cell wall biosynthesis
MEKYLKRCLESVICQSYKNLQIILVNDGSKDKSLDICNSYVEKDNRIILINKINGGLSSARNEGYKRAKGEYIYFLDSDDYIDQNAMERFFEKTIDTEVDVIIGNYVLFNLDGEVTYRDSIPKIYLNTEFFNHSSERFNLFFGRSYGTTAWNKLYSADFLNRCKIEFEPNSKIFAEDLLFNIKLFTFNPRIITIQDYTYNYFKVEGSITTSFKPRLTERYINLLDSYYTFLEKRDIADEYTDLLCFLCLIFIENSVRSILEYSNSIKSDFLSMISEFDRYEVFNSSVKTLYHKKIYKTLPSRKWRIYAYIVSILYSRKRYNKLYWFYRFTKFFR